MVRFIVACTILAALSSITGSYTIGVGNFRVRQDSKKIAAWAQDDWQISNRLHAEPRRPYDLGLGMFANDISFPRPDVPTTRTTCSPGSASRTRSTAGRSSAAARASTSATRSAPMRQQQAPGCLIRDVREFTASNCRGRGRSAYQGLLTTQRHRAVFSGIWQVGRGFQLSGLHYLGAGIRRSAIYGGDLRNTGSTFSGRLRPDGTIVPLNSIIAPPQNRTDIRLQQRISRGGRRSIDAIAEIFNIFDRPNWDIGTQESTASQYLQAHQRAVPVGAGRLPTDLLEQVGARRVTCCCEVYRFGMSGATRCF